MATCPILEERRSLPLKNKKSPGCSSFKPTSIHLSAKPLLERDILIPNF